MLITKEILEQIAPSEIFRVVTTKIQAFHEPLQAELTFVCVKGRDGTNWAIYGSLSGNHPEDIARYGNKLHDEENIRSICPCSDEVYELYRH